MFAPISIPVNQLQIDHAIAVRQSRDAIYGNIYVEESSDLRWVGDLGEIVFDEWLRSAKPPIVFVWNKGDKVAGQPDFIVNNRSVDVKTVKRQVAVRSDYTAQITARHALEPVSSFFFMSFNLPRQEMQLLGGCSKKRFLAHATYFKAGDQVHNSYTIRPGHEIYNSPITDLFDPNEWLSGIRSYK